jgi:putative membrane protein
MKKVLLSAFVLSSVIAFTACESTETKDTTEVAEEKNEEKFDSANQEKTADFVVEAAAGNYAEIEFAKIGETRSADKEIKKMAADLVAAHTTLLGEVKSLAATKNISVPTSADQDAMDKAKDLNETKAEDFDKKWVNEMIDKHKSTIDKYEKYANKTDDADFKNWLLATIPKVREHLTMLEAKKDKMKS